MREMISQANEWTGRVIAYLGGGGLSVFSADVAAKTQHAAEVASSADYSFVPMLVSVGGLLVVAGRLVFDVWKYFDIRNNKLEAADE